MKKITPILSTMYPYSFLGLLLLILFWQVFFKGYVFIDGDNFHLNMPLKYLLVDAVKNGYFPFWNPYILGGVPYAADLNLGTFNPLNILYLFFPVPRALTLQVVLELFLLGSFQYLFLRLFKLKKEISLFGSIIFMLSGTIFLYTSNNAILHAIVYVPLLFFFAKKYFQTKKTFFFIFLIIAQCLQIISGHPQMTYYTMLFISFYILFQAQASLKKRILILFVYAGVSLLISAFQLVPFFEYVRQSTRPVDSLSYALSGSLVFPNILTIFFPTFFGTREFGNWWGSQTMLFGYMGAASLIFFVCGFFYKKFEDKIYCIVALMLSFLLALGKVGLLFYVFYYIVPGWSSLRSPEAIFVLTTFFVSLFSAFGLQSISENAKRINIHARFFLFISLLSIVGSGLMLLTTNFFVSWVRIFVYLSLYAPQLVQKVLFYSPEKIQSVCNGIILNILMFSLLIFVTFTFISLFSKRGNALIVFFILLVSADLLYADQSFLQLAPLSFYNVSVVQPLQRIQNQNYRVFSPPVVIPHDKRFLPGPAYFYKEGILNLTGLTDNHVIVQKIMGITGYTALVLKNYALFISGKTTINGVDTKNILQGKLNALSVRYILSLTRQGKLSIQENTSALPRVRLQYAKQRDMVTLQKSNPNTVNLTVSSQNKNTLILADTYYPGWNAYVNGKETQIRIYNKVFRQISVPAGYSKIQIVYDPISWKIGAIISILGVGLLLFISRLRFL